MRPPHVSSRTPLLKAKEAGFFSLAAKNGVEFADRLLEEGILPLFTEPSLTPSTDNPYHASASSCSSSLESSMALTFDDELDFRQKFNLATALAEWDKPEEELAESGPEDDEASEELKV